MAIIEGQWSIIRVPNRRDTSNIGMPNPYSTPILSPKPVSRASKHHVLYNCLQDTHPAVRGKSPSLFICGRGEHINGRLDRRRW